MTKRDTTTASGDASVSIGGDSHAPVTTTSIGTQVLGTSLMPLATRKSAVLPAGAARGLLCEEDHSNRPC